MLGQLCAYWLPLVAISAASLVSGVQIDNTVSVGNIVAAVTFLVAGLVILKMTPIRVAKTEAAIERIDRYIETHEKWSKDQTAQFMAQIAVLSEIAESNKEQLRYLTRRNDEGNHKAKGTHA